VEGCKQDGDHIELLAVTNPTIACNVTAHVDGGATAAWTVVLVSASGNRGWLACPGHRAAAIEAAYALMPRRS
jgi:hypothetical protein